MRHLAVQAGLVLTIDSAGTGGWHAGDPPDPRAIAAAARAGFDISAQRARQVITADFAKFRHVIAMDGQNLATLHALDPGDGIARLDLLLNHAPGLAGRAVPDPYYGPDAGFDDTVALVRAGCTGLLDYLKG